eukprot:15431963-Alexandrium_andersonii.AAC.1
MLFAGCLPDLVVLARWEMGAGRRAGAVLRLDGAGLPPDWRSSLARFHRNMLLSVCGGEALSAGGVDHCDRL